MSRRPVIKKHILNSDIRAKEVRLIDENAVQLGVVSIESARSLAAEKELDLLLVSDSTPPVCKLVNFGQFIYQQKKKDKQSKRTAQVTKEVKLSPKISENDYQVRYRKASECLQKKNKVKATVFFKGREIVHQEIGLKVLNRFIDDLKEFGTAENNIGRSGRTITVQILPK